MRQWIIIGTILCSLSTYGADFLIEVQPKTDSVGVQELKTELKPTCSSTQKMRYDGSEYVCEDITSSSILNFASEVISAMSTTLSNYLLKTDIPNCTSGQVLTKIGDNYSCVNPVLSSSPWFIYANFYGTTSYDMTNNAFLAATTTPNSLKLNPIAGSQAVGLTCSGTNGAQSPSNSTT